MRKRKYVIGLAAGVVLSLSVASVAHGALVWGGQSLVVTPSSPPQDKKMTGPLNSFFTDVITAYTNTGPRGARQVRHPDAGLFPDGLRVQHEGPGSV